jgi:septal ring factor EnvC (AmiA/AmiB activator)
MHRGAARACALVACAIGALATFQAASAETHRTAAQAERDRRDATTRAEQLRSQEAAARRDLAALDQRLVEAGLRRAAAEAQAATAEHRLTALRAQMSDDAAARQRSHDALQSAIIAAALAERGAELSAVRAGIFARAAAPQFSEAQSRYSRALADDRLVEAAILAQQNALSQAQTAIDAERSQILALSAQRRSAAAALAGNAAAAEARARQYASEATTLRDLAARVQRRLPHRPGSGAAIIPADWQAPATGRIVRPFGARASSDGPAAQGATLRTRSGAQVLAPATGQVAYAGLFRSYGQVLILNLDGGYVVVLTGLETINARVGDTVRAGQPIGEMPSSDTSAPELYVEVRREGRPIDPGRWLTAAADRSVRDG